MNPEAVKGQNTPSRPGDSWSSTLTQFNHTHTHTHTSHSPGDLQRVLFPRSASVRGLLSHNSASVTRPTDGGAGVGSPHFFQLFF